MNSKRMFFAMLGASILLLALSAAGTYLAHQQIVAEGKKVYDLKLEDAVLSKQVTNLQQAKSDIKKYEELETIARSVVPQDKDQARTVLELVNIAREAGITVTAVKFPASQLGMLSKNAKPAAKNTPTADSSTTQLTPLDSPKGVYSMEIQVETSQEESIRYSQLIDYLKRLENNRRTAQVSSLSITPDPDNRNLVTFSITLKSFVKP